MLRSRSKVRRNQTDLSEITNTMHSTLIEGFPSCRQQKHNTCYVEPLESRNQQRQLPKRSSCSSSLLNLEDLSDIQLRARHYLLKYRILDQPEVSFSLVNIILEERQRLLEGNCQSNQPPARMKNATSQFLPAVQQHTRTTTIHENRQEVINLAKWLDCRLETLRKSESITINDILSFKQTVLNLGLNQIIRMVAVACKQRASLLRLVWDSTFEIFQQVVLILTRHSEEQERAKMNNSVELNEIFEERLKGERDRFKNLQGQHLVVLEHFKLLIIQYRRLKKDNKELELKHRMLEYSLESYKEGYEVALQMALQSGDGNIMAWAEKILGKLVREKRRKKKKFPRIAQDQLVYRKSVEVVWEWLKHNVDDIDEPALQRYSKYSFEDDYQQQSERKPQGNLKKKNVCIRIDQNEMENVQDQSRSGQENKNEKKSLNNGKLKEFSGEHNLEETNLPSSEKAADTKKQKGMFSDESDDEVNIYDYFKLTDVCTSMDIAYADRAVGQSVPTANKSIQTWTVKTSDASTMTDEYIAPAPLEAFMDPVVVKRYARREGKVTKRVNMSINETDEVSNNVSITVKSVSNKKEIAKKKKLRINVSSQKSQSPKKPPGAAKNAAPKVKKNNVKINKKYHKRRQDDTSVAPVSRSGSTAFIAYDLDRKPRAMNSDLQLNKFEEVFEQERERMIKNPEQFLRDINDRRSFANLKEVEYGSYGNYELSTQKWAILKKEQPPRANAFNAYNEFSRKLKQFFDRAPLNSNIMKKKTFRQNTQIFLNVAGSVQLAAVRDQKASSTLIALNKIFSSLLIEHVKQVKKDKEDKDDRQGQRFFYPLNALYVDKFINTYGLKEIAEKNMSSTLRNIIGLTHRSEKMRLFAILLGVYDRNVGGDELQLYIRSLVYFDTRGKVALQMRDFNIERLATEKIAVQQNLSKVVQGFFTAEQTAQLQEEVLSVFDQNEPSIQTITLMLIEAHNRNKADKVNAYLSLHNYLVNHRTFLGNFIELLGLIKLERSRENDVLRYFITNLDLIEESNRCITPQRFLSTCIKCSLPTIKEMCDMLLASIQRFSPPESLKTKIFVQVTEESIGWLLRMKKEWELPIESSLLQELESALQLEDKQLTQFWWLLTVASMFDKRIEDLISQVVGNLSLISVEECFNQLKRMK